MLDMNENGGSSTSLSYFITTTWNMVDDLLSDSIISWSMSGKSFIIWNPQEFYRDLLPKSFDTSDLETFFYQLDMHGFRKTDSEQWEFANDNFVRGKPHLMKNIISYITEKRDQLYQRRDMRKAVRLFRLQVEEVDDELQHTRFKVLGIKEHHTSLSSQLFLFLDKAYEMVDDPSSDTIISWSQTGKSFIIWNPQEFYKDLLQRLFKTNHIFLFFYQLERYGFRKIDSEKWEFANDDFVQGQPHLVENIRITSTMDIDQFSKEWDRRTEMSDAKCLFKVQVKEVDGKDEFGVLNSLPPFITTTYKMVDDPSLDSIISWSQKNNSFIIWDMSELERYLLHEKLMTKSVFFFRLDIYGFKKIYPDRWEFANDNFIRDQPQLMENIIRQKIKEEKEKLIKRIDMRKKMRNAMKENEEGEASKESS